MVDQSVVYRPLKRHQPTACPPLHERAKLCFWQGRCVISRCVEQPSVLTDNRLHQTLPRAFAHVSPLFVGVVTQLDTRSGDEPTGRFCANGVAGRWALRAQVKSPTRQQFQQPAYPVPAAHEYRGQYRTTGNEPWAKTGFYHSFSCASHAHYAHGAQS